MFEFIGLGAGCGIRFHRRERCSAAAYAFTRAFADAFRGRVQRRTDHHIAEQHLDASHVGRLVV